MGARDLIDGLPAVFVGRLAEILPADRLDAAIASFAVTPPLTARVNPLRGSLDAVVADLEGEGIPADRIAWLPEGLSFNPADRDHLVRHAAVDRGCLYVQGAASWLPVVLLDPRPGEEVLDLAAAPGGKASHIAARMNNVGRLACVEPIRGRFFRLKATLDRLGVTCASLYLKDGRAVGGAVPGRFDRVLLDAPCSSEAQMRAFDPDTFAHWSERKVREASRKQRGLIRSAFQALKPGGRLVYATCSLAPEEGEAVVTDLLRAEPLADVLPVVLPEEIDAVPGLPAFRGEPFDPRVTRARRVVPGEGIGAFFLAVIAKSAAG